MKMIADDSLAARLASLASFGKSSTETDFFFFFFFFGVMDSSKTLEPMSHPRRPRF
jgi:hypothetical protein